MQFLEACFWGFHFKIRKQIVVAIFSIALGIQAVGNHDVWVPTASLCKNTLHGIFDDEELVQKLFELKEANGGELVLTFYYKTGSDGSKGHPVFKMVLDEERDQGALYASGMIPMQVIAKQSNGQVAILYNNSLVNSSLSWRPLRLLFKSETNELIKEEKERLDRERQELAEENYELFEGIKVNFVGFYAMADMKALCLKII